MKSRRLTCITTMTLFAALAVPIRPAAANPVPLINLPLTPGAIKPGGAGFKLTVNGTGFVSSSVVHWNGKARTTHFVNGSRVTATVFATDIAKAGTASITVANPTPGVSLPLPERPEYPVSEQQTPLQPRDLGGVQPGARSG